MDVDDDAVSVRGGKGKKKSAWKRGKQGESSLFSSISRMLPRNMNMYVKFGVSTHSYVGGGGCAGWLTTKLVHTVHHFPTCLLHRCVSHRSFACGTHCQPPAKCRLIHYFRYCCALQLQHLPPDCETCHSYCESLVIANSGRSLFASSYLKIPAWGWGLHFIFCLHTRASFILLLALLLLSPWGYRPILCSNVTARLCFLRFRYRSLFACRRAYPSYPFSRAGTVQQHLLFLSFHIHLVE